MLNKRIFLVIDLIIEKVSLNYNNVLANNYSVMDNIIQLAIKYNINRNIELLEYIDEKLMLAVNKYFFDYRRNFKGDNC